MKVEKIIDEIKEDLVPQKYDIRVKRSNLTNLIGGWSYTLPPFADKKPIIIHVNPNFEKKMKRMCKKLGMGLEETMYLAAYAIIQHEMDHDRVCPKNLVLDTKIKEGIDNALNSLGLTAPNYENIREKLSHYFTNIVVNLSRGIEDYLFRMGKGILDFALGYERGYSLLDAILVDAESMFYQDNPMFRNLAKTFNKEYRKSPNLQDVSRQVLLIFVEEDRQDFPTLLNNFDFQTISFLQTKIKDEESWPNKAKEFTMQLYPFL